jgi:membrane-bound lytic murein transglycosylase D
VLMKYVLPAMLFAILVLIVSGGSLRAEAKDWGTMKSGVLVNQDNDQDGELPDDPLSPPIGPGIAGKEGNSQAGLLPGSENLSGKAKKAFEALRDALHEADTTDDFDIPVVINDAVDRHIKCFTGPKRDVFARWLVRSEKYAPTIRGILKKNGLPEDLVYLSMIESGFNMKARSRASASGPWQFMNETGKQYGLRVDYWVDERYDLEKSTVAAARYLKNLFDQFGCWYLAAASYNAGENRVKKAIEKRDTTDFWKLREYKTLPKETQEYVPQLIAAALIAKEPEKYGFDDIEFTPVHSLTKIAVPGGIPLKGIARALSVDVADLRALNPEILKGITPPDRKEYQIKLPGNPELDVVSRRLEAALARDRRVVDVVRHSVRKRESLAGILRRYDISRSDLALVNESGVQAHRGQILYIPRFASLKRDETEVSARPAIRIASMRGGAVERARLSGKSEAETRVVVLKHRGKGHRIEAAKVVLASATVKKSVKKADPAKTHKKSSSSRTVRKTSR